MGNSGVYGDRRAKRMIHDGSIDDAEIATTAVGIEEVEDELKTGQIIVQLGAGGATHYLTKPAHAITITDVEVFGSIAGATAGTVAGLTITLKSADAGGATTATLAGCVATLTAATSTLVKSVAESGLSVSLPATKGLFLVAGATTLVDDNAAAIIQYTID